MTMSLKFSPRLNGNCLSFCIDPSAKSRALVGQLRRETFQGHQDAQEKWLFRGLKGCAMRGSSPRRLTSRQISVRP
jgi:hypothetical protein